jgi:hypothetical protein
MTPEEMIAKLKAAGIDAGAWGKTTAGEVKSPIVEKQKLALQKVQLLLEGQVQQDQVKLSALHAHLQQLKHGGGS